MAFKLTVDYNKLSLVVETDATEPTTTFIYAKSSVTYQFIEAVSAYESMSLSDVYLDADTKNLYFTAGFDSPHALTLTMAEAISSIDSSLAKSETAILTEAHAIALEKALSDAATLSEEFAKVMQFNRSYSDSYALGDSTEKGVTLPKVETLNLSESSIRDLSLSKSDTYSVSDSSVLLINSGQSDTITMAEAFSRVVQFARTFADAFTLDDIASGTDVLKTDTTAAKSNIVGITETLAQALSKPLSESVSVAESFAYSAAIPLDETISLAESAALAFALPASETVSVGDLLLPFSFSKSLEENATMSESIDVLLIPASQSSILNAAALNVAVLNG